MSEEEIKTKEEIQTKNDALKKELLETQIHDIVNEFESLKNLNMEYLQTNKRLTQEINDLKELNEQQVILSDTMLDKNKAIFKGTKRNVFWIITIFSLIAIILSFQFINKRVDDTINRSIHENIQRLDNTILENKTSLQTTQELQKQISKKEDVLRLYQEEQNVLLEKSKREFQDSLNSFKVHAVQTNEAITAIKNDYELEFNNFKTLLLEKELAIKDLKNSYDVALSKINMLSKNTSVKTIPTVKKQVIKKAVIKKPKKDVNVLLQNAFRYQNQQYYSKAIETYNEIIKLNPKKDIAYYNLGIIYGNQKKYTKAIAVYKKSLHLNPKRNLTFTNLFEILLISNKTFDSSILNQYKLHHKDKKISFIKYEMLDIFKDVKQQQNIDKKLHTWQKSYATTSLGNWSFKMLRTWINQEKDITTKNNLLLVLKTFENHK